MSEAQAPKILRVGVIQGGKIIEEKLVRKRATVTVGTAARNSIVLTAVNAPKAFPLFEFKGADTYLNFTDQMTGRVSVKEEAADLQSLKAQNLVRKTGDTYQLRLTEESKGRVSVGESILLFQFVSPPPEPTRPSLPSTVKGYWVRNIDWPYATTFWSTVSFMVVLWIWAGSVPVAEEGMGIEDIPDRFAKLLMPDKLEEKENADEGKGKQEEQEKKKDKKQEKKEEVADTGAADTPAAAAVAAQVKRERMEKKVAGRGLLKILGAKGMAGGLAGGAVADVFGDGAIDGAGEDAFAGVGGMDVATASGQRGQRGLSGAASAAGIEDLGTRGVVGGAGQGGRGKAEAQVVARVSSAALQEFDSDSREQKDIVKSIGQRIGGIKHCYEKRLKRNPELKGKIVIRFVIHPGGKVIDAEVVENTTGDSELAACIVERVRSIRFPAAEGGETSVTYPFILAPGS